MNKLKQEILIRLFGWKHGWKVLRYSNLCKTYISSHSPKESVYRIGEKVTRRSIKLRGKKVLFGPLAVFDDNPCAEKFRRDSPSVYMPRSTHSCLYKPSKDNTYWCYAPVLGRRKKIHGPQYMPDGKAFADAVIIL